MPWIAPVDYSTPFQVCCSYDLRAEAAIAPTLSGCCLARAPRQFKVGQRDGNAGGGSIDEQDRLEGCHCCIARQHSVCSLVWHTLLRLCPTASKQAPLLPQLRPRSPAKVRPRHSPAMRMYLKRFCAAMPPRFRTARTFPQIRLRRTRLRRQLVHREKERLRLPGPLRQTRVDRLGLSDKGRPDSTASRPYCIHRLRKP